MKQGWNPDPSAALTHRLGKSPAELGNTDSEDGCPDIWQLDNGDFAVIGRDLTDTYRSRLPAAARVAAGERMVIIPRNTLTAAKQDIPDE